MNLNTFFIVTSFIFVVLSCVHGQSIRSGYGEFCNGTVKCDKKSWLSCRNSTCDCMFTDEMLYDAEVKNCLSKTGERCKFAVSGMEIGGGTFKIFEQTGCVSNADCGIDGICNCNSNFFESVNGLCLPEKGYAQNCSSNIECSQRDYLNCINGLCACNNTQVLDQGSCFGRAGMAQTGKSCVNGSVLLDGRCDCSPRETYYAGNDGKCHERQGNSGTCSENSHCESYLVCLNGTCSCNPEEFSFAVVQVETTTPIEVSCVEYFEKAIECKLYRQKVSN